MLKKILVLFITIFISIFIFLGFLYCKDNYFKKTYSNSTNIDFYVKKGESINSITNKLYANKIISSKLLFKIYGKLNKINSNIKFGNHIIKLDMTYKDIYDELSKNTLDKENFIKITIPEGYTIEQIASTLEDNGLVDSKEFLKLCKIGDFDFDFLYDIPVDTDINFYKLEGFLFPDTYHFEKNTTSEKIIIAMLNRFQEIVNKFENNSSYSFYDAIKIASIVERESAKGSERPIIAGIFYNRLNSNMKLESCATVEYILNTRKRVLSKEDISTVSPYNTYLNLGLPLTPISNPGKESLDAAFNPQNTNYLFFVSKKGTNEHAFGKTYNEHLRNVKKFRD